MRYQIHYSCTSHIGNIRSTQQDNFLCDDHFFNVGDTCIETPLHGTKSAKDTPVFGVFDGMGGEECGEIASYIAAKAASTLTIQTNAIDDLAQFCHKVNEEICEYAAKHAVMSMGTTAAMLAFTEKEVVLCNIGDSKIFQLSNGQIKQISQDHIAVSAYGTKPPLLQNLGIPPEEMVIDPYFARGAYRDGDIYVICSDGLTDMVSQEEIANILQSNPVNRLATLLQEKALANGGKDNVTIIVCQIKRRVGWLF